MLHPTQVETAQYQLRLQGTHALYSLQRNHFEQQYIIHSALGLGQQEHRVLLDFTELLGFSRRILQIWPVDECAQ